MPSPEDTATGFGNDSAWNAVTCHRFCAGGLVRQRERVQRSNPGREATLGEFDGDKSPAKSGDKSPHSKPRRPAARARPRRLPCICSGVALAWFILFFRGYAADTFRIGTYNVEMYLDSSVPALHHEAKSDASRAKVREGIKLMAADVLAIEEMGSSNALTELQTSLRHEGLDYRYAAQVEGYDTNLHVALLSKFPILSQKSHTDDKFLLHGRRFKVTRGFGEFEIEVNPEYRFTILAAHLKSKRLLAEADESEMREQEAILLREHVDAIFAHNPDVNLVVLGDLNDTKDSRSIHSIIGKGQTALVDTRPAEQNGDEPASRARWNTVRLVTWTHHFAKEDTYSRIDYILLSKSMAREWQASDSRVVVVPNWGIASDHRPIVAQFSAHDR